MLFCFFMSSSAYSISTLSTGNTNQINAAFAPGMGMTIICCLTPFSIPVTLLFPGHYVKNYLCCLSQNVSLLGTGAVFSVFVFPVFSAFFGVASFWRHNHSWLCLALTSFFLFLDHKAVMQRRTPYIGIENRQGHDNLVYVFHMQLFFLWEL